MENTKSNILEALERLGIDTKQAELDTFSVENLKKVLRICTIDHEVHKDISLDRYYDTWPITDLNAPIFSLQREVNEIDGEEETAFIFTAYEFELFPNGSWTLSSGNPNAGRKFPILHLQWHGEGHKESSTNCEEDCWDMARAQIKVASSETFVGNSRIQRWICT